MKEPEFSNLFNNMLKQIDKNIIIHNGQQCYRVPVTIIDKLTKLFFENDNINQEEDNKNNKLGPEDFDNWNDFNFFCS